MAWIDGAVQGKWRIARLAVLLCIATKQRASPPSHKLLHVVRILPLLFAIGKDSLKSCSRVAALACIHSVNETRVGIRVIGISGTIKGATRLRNPAIVKKSV